MQLKQDEELGAVPEMAFDVSQAEYVFYDNKMLLLKDVLKARKGGKRCRHQGGIPHDQRQARSP